MGPKQYLGDLALLYNTARTATVRAMTPCFLWALESSEFKNKLIALKRNHHNTSIEFLEKLDCFSQLTSEQKDNLAREMLLEKYSNGASIVSQGDDATAMFIIKSGRVEIIKDDRFVTHLGMGAYFGENALSSGPAKRSATIRAVGDVECFSINKGVLKTLFGQDVGVVVSMNEQRRLFAISPVLN